MPTLRRATPPGHIGLERSVSVQKVFPAEPAAVPAARHLLTSALKDWGLAPMAADASLVISELTANAVSQGQFAPPAEVLVRISRTSRYLIIQIGDHNPDGPPRRRRRVPGTAEHGRGLRISRDLSARLAWYRKDRWKLVWAALRKPAAAGESHPARRGNLGRAA